MDQLPTRRIALGIILVIAGVLLLFKNFGMLPYYFSDAIFNWPMLIMAIGAIALINRTNKTPGLIIFFIGAYFWIDRYLNLDLRWAQAFWPLVIITIGIYILVKHGRKNNWQSNFQDSGEKKNDRTEGPEITPGGSDTFDEIAIFGGGDRSVSSMSFKGGKATCIFGGSDINFKNAKLINNQPAVIDLLCIFGGVSLKVPNDWTVHSEVTPLLGGFGDDRDLSNIHPDPSKVLIVKGLVIFGGGDIKSA